MLYENINGGKYNSQSKVDASTKEFRYLAMVLLHTSAAALHWGCRAEVVWCFIWSRSYSLADILLTNYFPWSVINSSGNPYQQIHFEKIAEVTVNASLSGKATNPTYFVNASVMHNMYFLEFSLVLSGPNRSA